MKTFLFIVVPSIALGLSYLAYYEMRMKISVMKETLCHWTEGMDKYNRKVLNISSQFHLLEEEIEKLKSDVKFLTDRCEQTNDLLQTNRPMKPNNWDSLRQTFSRPQREVDEKD